MKIFYLLRCFRVRETKWIFIGWSIVILSIEGKENTLIERMVDGTEKQAAGRSIAELEQLRDNCLIDILAVVDKYRDAAAELAMRETKS